MQRSVKFPSIGVIACTVKDLSESLLHLYYYGLQILMSVGSITVVVSMNVSIGEGPFLASVQLASNSQTTGDHAMVCR